MDDKAPNQHMVPVLMQSCISPEPVQYLREVCQEDWLSDAVLGLILATRITLRLQSYPRR